MHLSRITVLDFDICVCECVSVHVLLCMCVCLCVIVYKMPLCVNVLYPCVLMCFIPPVSAMMRWEQQMREKFLRRLQRINDETSYSQISRDCTEGRFVVIEDGEIDRYIDRQIDI